MSTYVVRMFPSASMNDGRGGSAGASGVGVGSDGSDEGAANA